MSVETSFVFGKVLLERENGGIELECLNLKTDAHCSFLVNSLKDRDKVVVEVILEGVGMKFKPLLRRDEVVGFKHREGWRLIIEEEAGEIVKQKEVFKPVSFGSLNGWTNEKVKMML